MRSVLGIFSIAVVVTIAASILALSGSPAEAQSPVSVTMGPATGPDGGGEQTGTATLTAMGSQTEVVLSIGSSPDGATVEQPAHVHAGTCDNLGSVEYPLTNVVDGTSTTLIDASLESLQTGDFSINVHKSGTELGAYVSCGDIPASAGTPGDVPSTGGAPASDGGTVSLAYVLAAVGGMAVAGGAAMGLAARRTG